MIEAPSRFFFGFFLFVKKKSNLFRMPRGTQNLMKSYQHFSANDFFAPRPKPKRLEAPKAKEITAMQRTTPFLRSSAPSLLGRTSSRGFASAAGHGTFTVHTVNFLY